MEWINNKGGPGFYTGFPVTGRPRDGTERKSHNKTILRKGTFVDRPLGPVMGEVCPVVKEVRSSIYEVRMKNRE